MKKASLLILLIVVACHGPGGRRMSARNAQTNPLHKTADKKQAPVPSDKPDSCEALAEQIMMSTPVFKKLAADTPHWMMPSLEDGCYTFQLYHDFEDHISTTAWIVVDMKQGKAFEQDIPADTLLPIEADAQLIGKIEQTCGGRLTSGKRE